MKQFVFLKQVPASTQVQLDPVAHTILRCGNKAQTNPYDLHALQAAVEIRKQTGGTITAVTMGPPQAEAILREACMYGADEGVLISDPLFAGSDTWSTVYILCRAIEYLGGGNLLHFGKQAIDGDTGQVGPGVAARLQIPQLTDIIRIHSVSRNKLVAERLTDTGVMKAEGSYPLVLTYQKEVNRLPLPTLTHYEQAQKKKIYTFSAAQLSIDGSLTGLQGSPTQVVSTFLPENNKEFHWIEDITELMHIVLNLSQTK